MRQKCKANLIYPNDEYNRNVSIQNRIHAQVTDLNMKEGLSLSLPGIAGSYRYLLSLSSFHQTRRLSGTAPSTRP